jgi:hypothetical protein
MGPPKGTFLFRPAGNFRNTRARICEQFDQFGSGFCPLLTAGATVRFADGCNNLPKVGQTWRLNLRLAHSWALNVGGGTRHDEAVANGVLENRVHRIKLANERLCARCLSAGRGPTLAVLNRNVPNRSVPENLGEILDEIPIPFSRALSQFVLSRVKPTVSQHYKVGVRILRYLQDACFFLEFAEAAFGQFAILGF